VTRSRDRGSNEITEEAKRKAIREGTSVSQVLDELLAEAKAAHDTARIKKIQQAQKYLGSRNIRKRESNR